MSPPERFVTDNVVNICRKEDVSNLWAKEPTRSPSFTDLGGGEMNRDRVSPTRMSASAPEDKGGAALKRAVSYVCDQLVLRGGSLPLFFTHWRANPSSYRPKPWKERRLRKGELGEDSATPVCRVSCWCHPPSFPLVPTAALPCPGPVP